MQQPAPAVPVKKAVNAIYRQRENSCKRIQEQIDLHLNEIVKLTKEQEAIRAQSMVEIKKVTPCIWQIRLRHAYNRYYVRVQSFFTEEEAIKQANQWRDHAYGYTEITVVKIAIERLPARFHMGRKWVDEGELIQVKREDYTCSIIPEVD